MSVLGDSHTGIVPATVVYVYTSNAICSFFQQFEGYQSYQGDAKPKSIK